MFTGIIETVGEVRSIRPQTGGVRIALACPGFWDHLPDGGSVAVDGVCLTLTTRNGEIAEFDVIAESLRRSTLGELRPGSPVNLERSLTAASRLDGHFVQGHVDAVATVTRIERGGGEALWFFGLGREPMRYVIPKGGIAIDGISLTVASVGPSEFGVALIPTTLARTTLGRKGPGARVNIETDILARTVVHTLESIVKTGGGVSMELLQRHGYA